VSKTKVLQVSFLCDVACQKLLKSANVSRSYSKNNTGTVFLDTVYCYYYWSCVCCVNAERLSVVKPWLGSMSGA